MASASTTSPSFGVPSKSYGAHHKTLGFLIRNGDDQNEDTPSEASEKRGLNDDYDEQSQDEL
jgi:hypothetical protein